VTFAQDDHESPLVRAGFFFVQAGCGGMNSIPVAAWLRHVAQKKTRDSRRGFPEDGARSWTRTNDPLINSQVL
jgi:hypothetical protein